MADPEHSLSTDQAEREASGAHPYGRYLEEFEVGAVYKQDNTLVAEFKRAVLIPKRPEGAGTQVPKAEGDVE